jgi:integrase
VPFLPSSCAAVCVGPNWSILRSSIYSAGKNTGRSSTSLEKVGTFRTIPVPQWVKARIDDWTQASGTTSGRLFRSINKNGVVWGEGLTEKVVWYVVKNFAKTVGIEKVAPHDLRRTCARLCHVSGGELEQIQFLLGHVSVETTERYLGCKQKIRDAVNDRLGIEPEG